MVYAGTGSISTSEETMKTRDEIVQAERDAAIEIKANIWKYKFNDAIEAKGEEARLHFGVGAQTVGDIMRKHDLDPESYGFWCYNEWEDEVISTEIVNQETGEITYLDTKTGNKIKVKSAGSRHGIRYEELAMFILMAM